MQRCEDLFERRAEALGLGPVIGEGGGLGGEMGGLGQLHLDGVPAFTWAAIVAGGVAAFEAAVEECGEIGASTKAVHRALDARRAGLAHIRADVEVRQCPVKEKGDVRAYRVAIIEDCEAVEACGYARHLGLKGGVVRRVEGDTAALDLSLVGGGALKVDGHAVKVCGGTEGLVVF